jgi:hypothetical protein
MPLFFFAGDDWSLPFASDIDEGVGEEAVELSNELIDGEEAV